MDYIDFHVRRIADELQRAGVSIPGNDSTPATTNEPHHETEFSVAQGHKSTVYLPHWIRDHRDDPALMVSSFVVAVCLGNSRTLLLGLHGPPTCPPPRTALC